MKINEIVENIVKLNTEPKLDKLPHEEVESVIHRWVNQDDHIELSNGMHILSGENQGYDDNVALLIDQDYKIIDNDTDIVDLMQQFTAQEIDPSIVEAIVEKCWKGYEKKGMKTMFGKRVPNCVKKEAVEENLRAWFGKGKKGGAGGGGWDRYNTKGERIGKCGDSKKGEGKPKCLSKSRAASLRAKGGKKAIAAAVRKKRREDPNKNRRGKAKNVSNTTKKKKK
tara:strand:- start:1913 stop:2587 length:675 start_codon:yes stop_codon:yes gene_type:complete